MYNEAMGLRWSEEKDEEDKLIYMLDVSQMHYYEGDEVFTSIKCFNVRGSLNVFNFEDPSAQLFSAIKKEISEGHYVVGSVDRFYIKSSPIHNRLYKLEPIYLYGFDDEKECFYCAGHNKNYDYSMFEVTYQEFLQSVEYRENVFDESEFLISFLFFQYTKRVDVNINIDQIINGLQHYLSATNIYTLYRC